MNSAETPVNSQKNERMHQLALSMYRTGELSAALKIWKRLKENDPNFPDIDRWINQASKPPYPASRTKPETDPTVFRTQRDLMSQYGNTPRMRAFVPKTGYSTAIKRFRHRNIVFAFLIAMLFGTFLSVRNNRSYMIQLNPVSKQLDCYQGMFFPFGWQKVRELEIGIDSNWTTLFKEKKLINRLKRGVRVNTVQKFDELIIEVFMGLGDQALMQMTIRSQQSAIYYFKQIEAAHFRGKVNKKIAQAFINLTRMKIEDGDQVDARFYFQEARSYDSSNPELNILGTRLSSNDSPKNYL